MKIAIHHRKGSYSDYWIDYCQKSGISIKIVNCYDSDIVDQLSDCGGLMWHFHQAVPSDYLMAKQLLYALEISGKEVFPDFKNSWHFDDKVGQKYLFEAIGAPLIPSYVFYDKKKALKWAGETTFPKVFKLRGGSSSLNVVLIKTRSEARRVIKRAFKGGFSQFPSYLSLKERWRRYRLGKIGLFGVFKGVIRLFYNTDFEWVAGNEKGYVYFQDFIPNCSYDIRVEYICGNAMAMIRDVRKNDFRASGSGSFDYSPEKIPLEVLELTHQITERLELKTAAIDFLMHEGKPVIAEISYAFGIDTDAFDFGYWDSTLTFRKESFNPFEWMVDDFVQRINSAKMEEKKMNSFKWLYDE
jgi:glutathione synthase/RimK-type ligase-like ATP-grasp enzyme